MELISQIVDIYDNYEFTTEVLVASVRGRCTSPKLRRWEPISARAGEGYRGELQPPTDGYWSREVPGRLGEVSGDEGVMDKRQILEDYEQRPRPGVVRRGVSDSMTPES